jgi:anti-sigma factor RsiW
MTGETHPSARLHDLHDGRLPPEARAEVEQHLLSCARCRSELEALRALSGAARQLSGAAPPAGLEAVLRDALDAEDRRSARSGQRRRALVAASALAAAVVLVVWAVRLRSGPDWPALAMTAQEQIERGDLALDLREARPERLEAALRARGASVRVLDLAMMGLQLVGGSVREVGGRTVALIAYRDPQGRILLCEMLPGGDIRLPSPTEERRQGAQLFSVYGRGGRTAVFWREGPVLCVLVGTAPREEVIALAMAKARQPEP